MSAATLKPIRLECNLTTTANCLAPRLLVCFEPTVWPDTCSSVVAMYVIELASNMTPLWDQGDKNYHNRDLKPKLWYETREKLNATGKY